MDVQHHNSNALPRWMIVLIVAVLIVRLGLELRCLNQPIFEGYVGRQIPSAMVARDLSRDGSWLWPKLQTGPFPNYFLVEPPVYAGFVAFVHRLTDLPIEPCGRMVSLLGLSLAALAVWKTVRHVGALNKTGDDFNVGNQRLIAWVAVILMISFPVAIRYGRAFQPDATAIGLTFLGVTLVNQKRGRIELNLGRLLLVIGIATKITLFPYLLLLEISGQKYDKWYRRISNQIVPRLVFLIPAASWYLWVMWLKWSHQNATMGQSADGFQQWWSMIGPLSLLHSGYACEIIMNILVRSYGPIALAFVVVTIFQFSMDRRIIKYVGFIAVWLCVVGSKTHHAYYWLVPMPVIAIMAALGMSRCQSVRKYNSIRQYNALVAIMIVICVVSGLLQSRATWRTPEEWRPLVEIPNEIREALNRDPSGIVVAHEAAIYAIDRLGFRWEWPQSAQMRAAAVWGEDLRGNAPAALLQFYRAKGARWFLAIETDPQWAEGHAALSAILPAQAVAAKANGLILYSLTSEKPAIEKP